MRFVTERFAMVSSSLLTFCDPTHLTYPDIKLDHKTVAQDLDLVEYPTHIFMIEQVFLLP